MPESGAYRDWVSAEEAAAALDIPLPNLIEGCAEHEPWTYKLDWISTVLGSLYDPRSFDAAYGAYHRSQTGDAS